MKKCTKCLLNKSVGDFYIGPNGKPISVCKKCKVKYTTDKQKIVGSTSWWNTKFQKIRYSAQKRGVPFELTKTDFVTIKSQNKCFYCKEVCKVKTIDRVNNSKGYTRDNSVLACYSCNALKRGILPSQVNQLLKIVEVLKKL